MPKGQPRGRTGSRAGSAAAAQRALQSLAVQAISGTPDHIYMYGPDMRYLFANRAALTALELREDQVVGRTWQEIGLSAHVMEPFEQELRAAFATGDPKTGETDFPLPSGTVGTFQYVLSPIRGAQGQVDAVVCNVRDITRFVRTRRAVETIARPTGAATGEDYLKSLVVQLSSVLRLHDVFVGELIHPQSTRVRTVARAVDGAPAANIEYDLEGTPCANVVGAVTCVFTAGVQQAFPADRMLVDLGVESYIGVPLVDATRQPLGLIVGMDTAALPDPDWARETLELFAVRAGAELARRAADSRLQQAQQMLLNAERVAQFGSFEWDLATNEVRWSPGMYEIYGVDQATAPPITFQYAMSFVDPADVPEIERQVRTALETKGRVNVEYRIRRPDGTVRVLRGTSGVSLGPDGAPARLVGAVRDWTERAAGVQALRESERRYRALVDGAAIGIYQSSLDGRLLAANPAFVAMLGYDSEAEMLRLDLARDVYLNPAERARLVTDAHIPGRVDPVEVEWRRKDGTPITVRLTATRSLGTDGAPVFTVMAEDVTTRRRLETQLQQAQRMEGIGRLAGGIAHDFNNILAAITAYTDLLVSDLPEGSQQRADAEEIRIASGRATSLTRQLLAFSRQQVLAPRVLQVNDVVRAMDKMLRRIIGEDISLREELRAEGAVRADPAQLEQVLLNLVVNSRDAMRSGGVLTIATDDTASPGPIATAALDKSPAGWVRISVSDTGVGMDAETMARVFEPFFTTKPAGHGTGLGLATVYGIVRQSGGHVTLRSRPGDGATFDVYLPRVADQPDWQPQSTTEAARTLTGQETVLIVEDDAAVRRATHLVLERAGYTVVEASRPADAVVLGAATDRAIDLLLTDVIMPGMSGPEVYDAIRAHQPSMRVLYMSGYAAQASGGGPIVPPGSLFLAKPFTAERLTQTVRLALEAPRLDATTRANGGTNG